MKKVRLSLGTASLRMDCSFVFSFSRALLMGSLQDSSRRTTHPSQSTPTKPSPVLSSLLESLLARKLMHLEWVGRRVSIAVLVNFLKFEENFLTVILSVSCFAAIPTYTNLRTINEGSSRRPMIAISPSQIFQMAFHVSVSTTITRSILSPRPIAPSTTSQSVWTRTVWSRCLRPRNMASRVLLCRTCRITGATQRAAPESVCSYCCSLVRTSTRRSLLASLQIRSGLLLRSP